MAVVLMVLSAFKQDKVVTIFMIGDSTMANKSIKNGNKERGWGMALQCYFDDGIRIDNHAVNGRSSKSFIDEGRWQVVVDKIRPGDYVFIQFGHNDEKPKADRHTDPGTTFDANLSKFVRETRDKGGIPVLFNSVVRRNFMKVAPKNDDDEALRKTTGPTTVKSNEEGDSLVDTHGDYIVAPRNVAKELGVVFVDANKITHELEQGMGREASRKLHMWFMPGEEPSIPKGRQTTHIITYTVPTWWRGCLPMPYRKRYLRLRSIWCIGICPSLQMVSVISSPCRKLWTMRSTARKQQFSCLPASGTDRRFQRERR